MRRESRGYFIIGCSDRNIRKGKLIGTFCKFLVLPDQICVHYIYSKISQRGKGTRLTASSTAITSNFLIGAHDRT